MSEKKRARQARQGNGGGASGSERPSRRGPRETRETKHTHEATEIKVENRTLDAVLRDLAERGKENDAKATAALQRIDASLERMARTEEDMARAQEGIRIALDHLAALTKDHMTLAVRTEKMDAKLARTDARVDALEKKAS